MSDFIHSNGKTQALHPQAHAGLSWSCHERGHREELLLDTDPQAALWILTLGEKCYTGLRSVSKGNFGLLGMSGEGCKGGENGEGFFCFFFRCILCPPLWMSGIVGVIVYGSHAQTQSLFLLLHNNDTAQACHTACTSQASALDYRGPTTTLHRSLEAMPAVSGFSINSDGIY